MAMRSSTPIKWLVSSYVRCRIASLLSKWRHSRSMGRHAFANAPEAAFASSRPSRTRVTICSGVWNSHSSGIHTSYSPEPPLWDSKSCSCCWISAGAEAKGFAGNRLSGKTLAAYLARSGDNGSEKRWPELGSGSVNTPDGCSDGRTPPLNGDHDWLLLPVLRPCCTVNATTESSPTC